MGKKNKRRSNRVDEDIDRKRKAQQEDRPTQHFGEGSKEIANNLKVVNNDSDNPAYCEIKFFLENCFDGLSSTNKDASCLFPRKEMVGHLIFCLRDISSKTKALSPEETVRLLERFDLLLRIPGIFTILLPHARFIVRETFNAISTISSAGLNETVSSLYDLLGSLLTAFGMATGIHRLTDGVADVLVKHIQLVSKDSSQKEKKLFLSANLLFQKMVVVVGPFLKESLYGHYQFIYCKEMMRLGKDLERFDTQVKLVAAKSLSLLCCCNHPKVPKPLHLGLSVFSLLQTDSSLEVVAIAKEYSTLCASQTVSSKSVPYVGEEKRDKAMNESEGGSLFEEIEEGQDDEEQEENENENASQLNSSVITHVINIGESSDDGGEEDQDQDGVSVPTTSTSTSTSTPYPSYAGRNEVQQENNNENEVVEPFPPVLGDEPEIICMSASSPQPPSLSNQVHLSSPMSEKTAKSSEKTWEDQREGSRNEIVEETQGQNSEEIMESMFGDFVYE